jgi:hypothetical protein
MNSIQDLKGLQFDPDAPLVARGGNTTGVAIRREDEIELNAGRVIDETPCLIFGTFFV